jgi:hypothetical protein
MLLDGVIDGNFAAVIQADDQQCAYTVCPGSDKCAKQPLWFAEYGG